MTTILSRLTDERLMIDSSPVIASGDVGTVQLIIGFDFNWIFANSVSFFAAFYRTTPADSVFVLLNEAEQGVYSCMIPSEMLAEAGTFTFSVYAKNAAGDVVKTSTECRQKVVQGAFTGAAAYIDWKKFKADIIGLLNAHFAADLPESATVEEITAALDAAEINESARAELIEAVNGSLQTELSPSAEISEIIDVIKDYIAVSANTLWADWNILATGGYSYVN